MAYRHVISGNYAYWLVPVAVIVMLLNPFGPPPPKEAMAQKPPVLKPADPFDDINVVKRNPKVKIETIGSMPVYIGIGGQ